MSRILSIEDDASIQQIVSTALHLEGFDVHYAFSGDEGYKKLFSSDPDLVLLDMMLPGMSGADVLKAVHGHPDLRRIPIIVMTAYGGGGSRVLEQTVRALGAVEYIEKPFKVKELVRRVKDCLARHPRPSEPGREVTAGDFRLDSRLKTVRVQDKLVATLPGLRYGLLAALAAAEGPVPKEELLHRVWGEDGSLSALEKTVSRLRQDLGAEAYRLKTTPEGYELVTRADTA